MQVKCKVGDIVSKGQVVVVLEAMKMEYPITAPAAGQVSTLGSIKSAQFVAKQYQSSVFTASHRAQTASCQLCGSFMQQFSALGLFGPGQRAETSVLHRR